MGRVQRSYMVTAMGSDEAIREGQIISHDDTAKPVFKHGYRPPLPRAQVIAWAIRRGAWEQNSRVQSVMEGNRSHGHSDQGLRRFNVRAIFRGICGLNTSRHDELDEDRKSTRLNSSHFVP